MPEAGVTIETLPVGSYAADVGPGYGAQAVPSNLVDGLANGATSSPVAFANLAGATLGKVILILGSMSPIGTPVISITNGSSQYDLPVTTTSSAKRLEWNDIPVAFLASFSIVNSTGVALPFVGNSLIIMPV